MKKIFNLSLRSYNFRYFVQYTDQSRHYSRASRLLDKAVKEMDSKLERNLNSISLN